MGEHARLVRDLFNTFAIGCFGVAAFAQEPETLARVAYVMVGLYAHIIAHLAVAFGKAKSDV